MKPASNNTSNKGIVINRLKTAIALSGLIATMTFSQANAESVKFVKSGNRVCKTSFGFFQSKCTDKAVGKKADALNAQIGDSCDYMVLGNKTIYKLPDFYMTESGSNYLEVENGNQCKLLGKTIEKEVKVKQTSVLLKSDLKNAPILGQNAEVQPAQIVVKDVAGKVHWVTIYQAEVGIPVVELRDDNNVKLVVDRYLLAKGNKKAYDSAVGFRTQNCKKMAAENHDTFHQIQAKNYGETCLQVLGVNWNDEYVNAAIIPTSKLKNHIFRSVEKQDVTYTVIRPGEDEDIYTEEDFLLDLLRALFSDEN